MTQTPASALFCPRCNAPLAAAQASGAVLHGCSGCGGVWLDMATSHRFCERLDEDAEALLRSASSHAAYPVDTRAPISCPACQRPLQRTRLPQAGVDIDYCSEHGTWFDKDELARVAQSAAVARAYGQMRAASPNAPTPPPPTRSLGSSVDAEDVANTAFFGLEIVGLILDIFD